MNTDAIKRCIIQIELIRLNARLRHLEQFVLNRDAGFECGSLRAEIHALEKELKSL